MCTGYRVNRALSCACSVADSGEASAASGSESWFGRRPPVTTAVTRRSARSHATGGLETAECTPHGVVVDEVAVRLGPLRHPRSCGRGLAAAVLPGQPAARERAERREPEAALRAEGKHLALGLALEQRIGVLHPVHPRSAGAGIDRLRKLRAVDVAHADCAHLALPDHRPERAERLCDRDVGIPVVQQVERHPLDAEPSQAALELPPHARGRETVVLALAHRVVRLRREDDPAANVGPFRAQPVADVRLATAAAVGVGGVERGDAGLPRRVHQRERLGAALTLPEECGRRADAAEVAAAEDETRDLDAAPSERRHGPSLVGDR
jgi:hypothetical protein